MINNRVLPPTITSQLDHFGSSPAVPATQFNSAMATANAIAASINAQSLQSKQVSSPKEPAIPSPKTPLATQTSPKATSTVVAPTVQQPLVHVSLEIQLFPAEKLYPTPSMAENLSFDDEFDLRVVGCELIQTAGRLLKLPQTAMATGQVLFHRYFYIKSFVRNSMEIYAMAAVFLSSKIEECPRRIRDVMNVFHHMKQVRTGKVIKPMVVDEAYYETKNQVIKAERRMLKELGFCIHVKHPHKIIFIYLLTMDLLGQVGLSQKAWNFMNDSLRTDIFLRYKPENIVCACIYLSARELKIPLPQSPPWFLIFGADEDTIKEICVRIVHLYSHKTKSQEELEKVISECSAQLEAEKRKNREEKSKLAASSIAAAITTSAQESTSKKPHTPKDDPKKEEQIPETKSKPQIIDRKFPHQQRGHVSTPPDQVNPVLSHSNPYYLNHHHPSHGHPMSRHSSFNYPPYGHPAYMNGNGAYPPGVYPDHYQNENYYDTNMRKNKSSNDLISSSHYKDIDEYRNHSTSRSDKYTKDRTRSRHDAKEDYSRSKISNQTNKYDYNRSRSRSRSRSPWKKSKDERSDKKSRVSHRSRTKSIDSVESIESRSPASTKHKKKKSHHSSHRKDSVKESSSKDRDREKRSDRERHDRHRSSSNHHHKSSKSSKTRSREREVPICS